MQLYPVIPQDLRAAASPTWVGATLSGLTADRILFAGTGGLIDDDASLLWDNTNKYFIVGSADASDQIKISHNNTDAQFRTSDGTYEFITDEGDNTSSIIRVKGKGTGIGIFALYDENDEEYLTHTCSNGVGSIAVQGSSPAFLNIQPGAECPIYMFVQAAEGETQELQIYGYRTGDSKRHLQIGVGVDAADTASFDGVSNYWFNGAIESEGTTPYLTLHNSTHEDTDGGRESRLIFKGEQSGGEETSLAQVEISHDGSSDDQLGKIVYSINTGSGLVEGERLDSGLNAIFTKIKLTAIGGYAVKLTNKTGANTVAGQTVKADTATDDAVILTAADDDECIGVFLDSGIADAAEAWVVITGIADVAMEDNTAATHGNWVQTSETEAGYADSTDASPQAAPQHFNEIGHCIESIAAGGGGTHILARCILHFN